MRRGEPTIAQSETWLYCSFGERNVGWSPPKEYCCPTIIMSGSAQQPGPLYFQYSPPIRPSSASSIQCQESLRSHQERQQFAPASRAHSWTSPQPYWQKEKRMSRFCALRHLLMRR